MSSQEWRQWEPLFLASPSTTSFLDLPTVRTVLSAAEADGAFDDAAVMPRDDAGRRAFKTAVVQMHIVAQVFAHRCQRVE